MTLICGVGALGSRLTEHLARSGWSDLAVVDHDRVEVRNLSNQAYFRHQAGQPKVVAVAENVFRAVGVEVQIHKKRLSLSNGSALLRGVSLVVDCFDNHESRAALQTLVRQVSIPCLHVGLHPDGYAEVVWDPLYHVPPDPGPGVDPCLDPVSGTLAMLAVAVAAQTLEEFRRSRQQQSLSITLSDLAILPWTTAA